jgi:hypothetical protein
MTTEGAEDGLTARSAPFPSGCDVILGPVSADGYWRVAIAVPDEEVELIRHAAVEVLPAERHAMITEDPLDGTVGATELLIEVVGPGEREAREQAAELYRRVRAVARLSVDEPVEFIGLMSPIFGGVVWDRLWREAVELHAHGRHELAVVRAQTACETLAFDAVAGAFRGRLGREDGDVVARLFRGSLKDERAQRLIHGLTGGWAPLKFAELEWWTAYSTHVQRRNDVVHKGITVPAREAQASLDAVERCMAWLRELWNGGPL